MASMRVCLSYLPVVASLLTANILIRLLAAYTVPVGALQIECFVTSPWHIS